MKNAPVLSVIMSVYNGESYLEEAIESVAKQTFTDWELIVINDCSVDGTAGILEDFAKKDERIKVFPNEVNLKLPTSLNKAISLSTGKYILRMDADDICLPERFQKQYDFMEKNPNVDLSSCRFLTLKNGSYASGGCGTRCDSEAIRAMLLVSNPILHPGVIAKAQVMKDYLYNTSLTCTEDLELWTRMAKDGLNLKIQPEYLLFYRLHDKQITSTTLERQRTEVLGIQDRYYNAIMEEIPADLKDFYINGIYFRDNSDISMYLKFFRWLRSVNRKKRVFKDNVIYYAMMEILAEYKRKGTPKGDIIKTMMKFDVCFLVKEIIRRKKAASADMAKCMKTAEKAGLVQVAGSAEFPIFSKK